MQTSFVEFRHLEKHARRSERDFLKDLQRIAEELGKSSAVQALKSSGVCVGLYGENHHADLFNQSLNLIASFPGSADSVSRLREEAGLFNSIFQGFDRMRSRSGVNRTPPLQQVPALLIANEILTATGRAQLLGQGHEELMGVYPFAVALGRSSGKGTDVVQASTDPELLARGLDGLVEQTSLVLRYIAGAAHGYTGYNRMVHLKELKSARSHAPLVSLYRLLTRQYEYWRYFGSKIETDPDGVITCQPLDMMEDLGHKVSRDRFILIRTQWSMETARKMAQLQVHFDPTKVLPPLGMRSEREYLTTEFCFLILGSDSLDEELFGVSLSAWVRAYELLAEAGEKALTNRTRPLPFTLSKWSIGMPESGWVKLLSAGGIDSESARIVVRNLTFDSYARDLLDCPLIPIDGILVGLPSIMVAIDPAVSVLSNALARGEDVSFRGEGIEKRIRDEFRSRGIPCDQLKESDNGEEYQCDLAWIVDGHLFLGEVKAFVQPMYPREFYLTQDKISKAADQLNRIANYYQRQMSSVRRQFRLDSSWTPIAVHRVVITSVMVGNPQMVQGCHVIDESALNRFLSRKPLGMGMGNLRWYTSDPDYEGTIIAEKFLNMLSLPRQVEYMRQHFEERWIPVRLANKKVRLLEQMRVGRYTQSVADEDIADLARSLGMDEESFRTLVEAGTDALPVENLETPGGSGKQDD